MVKTNYANAYKEVLVILNNLIKEDYDKIPKEYIDFLESNCNNEYEFYFDTSKSFEEQELLDETKYILFGLFEKFGATQNQKEKIKAFRNNYYKKLEEGKKEKYNTDVFQHRNNNTQEQNEKKIVINEVAIVEYKEGFFVKLKHFIMKLLHINNS